MNQSEDITNNEAESDPREYGGYSPRHVNEFDVREESQSLSGGEEGPQPPFLDPDLSRGKPRDPAFSLASLIISCLLFIIFLIGGAASPCKFGLCGKIDRSSTLLQTKYEVQIYDFEAPFKFAWGAFVVFLFACAVLSLYNYVLSKKGTNDGVMDEIAAYIRKTSLSFLMKEFLLLSVVLIGLFILVGAGYSMRAAGCLAVGAITAIMLCVTTIMVATAGNVRAANVVGQSRYQQMTIELRTATVITVASYAFAMGGPAFSYLVFRDVRALSGYVIGAVTVSLFVRISGGIFYKASNIEDDPTAKGPSAFGSSRNNPSVFAANTGNVVGRAVGGAVQTFAAYTIAVVATSILATSFPYFGDNNYALCVFSHMEVDQTCTGFREPRKKLSFAATICRANSFFQRHPSLSVWASNTAFVAVPFILGFTGVLASILSVSYRTTPADADTGEENPDVRQKMRPFVRRVWMNVTAAAVITLISAVAVCFGLFGNRSAFFKENTALREVYKIPALTSDNAESRCRPLEATSDAVVVDNNLAGVPLLELSKQAYRTRDSFGEVFPNASETAWRLFLCIFLGVLLGMILGVGQGLIISISRSPSSRVAENGEFGASAVLVEGLGVSFLSTFGGFATVFILVLGCYGLYGAFGVGVSAIGMMSICAPLSVVSLYDVISDSALGIKGVVSRVNRAGRKTDAYESTGKLFSTIWKGIVNTGLVVGVVGLLFVVIQETNVTPSTRQLGGTVNIRPSRHVTDVDKTSMIDIYTLISSVIGLMGPLVFSGALMLGMSRIWHGVMTHGKKVETQGDYHRMTERVSMGSVIETVLPGLMTISSPLIIGFGFGQRGLLGMVTGVVSMSLLVSQAFCMAGGVWDSGARVVAGGRFEGEHKTGKWARAMSGGDNLGRALGEYVGPCVILAAAAVCGMSVVVVGMMQADASKWWIGVILAVLCGAGGVGLIVVLNKRYDEMMLTEKDVIYVDRRGISPFFEQGPSMLREHISPHSAMGGQRTSLNEAQLKKSDRET